jgi:hypothetical protein
MSFEYDIVIYFANLAVEKTFLISSTFFGNNDFPRSFDPIKDWITLRGTLTISVFVFEVPLFI